MGLTPSCFSRPVSAALFKPLREKLDIAPKLRSVVANLFGFGSKIFQLFVVHDIHKSWSEEVGKILNQATLDAQVDQIVRERS